MKRIFTPSESRCLGQLAGHSVVMLKSPSPGVSSAQRLKLARVEQDSRPLKDGLEIMISYFYEEIEPNP